MKILLMLFLLTNFLQASQITVNTNLNRKEISPYIFGINSWGDFFTHEDNWAFFRWGGNRTTAYNWTSNASNAGDDWYHQNDNLLVHTLTQQEQSLPGKGITSFHDMAQEYGVYSLVTLPMGGYVARDTDGTVEEEDTAPSSRWTPISFRKNSEYTLNPDPLADTVYVDELVNFLIQNYGNASTETGIRGYGLDNEPSLWPYTHERMHPDPVTAFEITDKGKRLASAVKELDPHSEIFGPVLYGFAAYTGFQGASDWDDLRAGKSYNWFLDYYLDEMKKASDEQGVRLLDVLSLNWYPEAQGDNRIAFGENQTINDHRARVQAPRTLWDHDYREDSWIGEWGGEHLPILPSIQASIDEYFPGTKMGFSEFNYGGKDHVSGGIAIADVLGIFAKHGVYMSTHWGDVDGFIKSGYRMFRNFDGNMSTFGNVMVFAETSDIETSSVYASVSGDNDEFLHLIVLNKDFNQDMTKNISIESDRQYISSRIWSFTDDSPEIQEIEAITSIESNTFSYTFAAGSVSHLVLYQSETPILSKANQPIEEGILSISPNPFNPIANVKFNVAENVDAKLQIVNVAGRVVDSKSIVELGVQNYSFNGSNLSSGVYFAVLKLGNRTYKQKMVLLK